tara:strand:- start:86686 stop:87360 length:675 start_codon:yes stop_codon:yes gene_type:complete
MLDLKHIILSHSSLVRLISGSEFTDMNYMQQTSSTPQFEAVIHKNDQFAGIDAEDSTQSVTRYVVAEINHNLYGVSTEFAVELTNADTAQITRVPQSPSYVAGVLNHRGTIIPVVDMRELLGFAPRKSESDKLNAMSNLIDQEPKQFSTKLDSMLVVVQVGERKAALIVDSVMCVADYQDDAIEVLPETADNTEYILGMVYQEDGTYTLIADLEHIFSTACPAE